MFSVKNAAISGVQCFLFLNSSNVLEIKRGTTVLRSGTTTLTEGVWYFIEFKASVHDSTGIMEVRLDGVVEIAKFTGDTKHLNDNGVITHTSIWETASSFKGNFDNYYVLNTEGTINNDYLGKIVCEPIAIESDDVTAWTRSAGTTNYENLDDNAGSPNDLTYVSSSTLNQVDQYDLANIDASIVVNGLKLISRHSKDGIAARSTTMSIESGANSVNQVLINTEVATSKQIIIESLDGSNAISDSDVNIAKLKIEVTK